MEYTNWNLKQEELFKCLLNNKEGIVLSSLIDYLYEYHLVWQSFYKLLSDNCEYFDDNSNIRFITDIEYNGRKYLFINHTVFNYIIIDMESKKSLSEKDFVEIFDKSILKILSKSQNKYDYYNIDEVSSEEDIINYYIDNIFVFSEPNSINYIIYQNRDFVSINVNIACLNSTIHFHSKENNINYLFINKNLELFGTSNPTGNKVSLKEMGNKIKDIVIPYDCIPKYITQTFTEDINKKTKKVNS